MDISRQIAIDIGVELWQAQNALTLFDEGATVPFIARYRKERTGGLDETTIRDMLHRYRYYTELDQRRAAILDSIREQGKLTAELEQNINATLNKTELEDLYLPFRPKRVTRGRKALDAGLEPLARWLAALEEPDADCLAKAREFIYADKGYATAQEALQGACDILAEELSDNADIRKRLRELAVREGFMVSTVRKEFAGVKTKFGMYYNYRERASAMPSHRVLAMLRGETEKVLSLRLELPREKAIAMLGAICIRHPRSAAAPHLAATVDDAFDRLLLPATETEIRTEIREKAEREAFRVFNDNLRALLLAPPAGRKPVLGVDPGFRTGCKVAAIDGTGKFLEYAAIFPHEPQEKTAEAEETLRTLIEKHSIELIAIGNGTASRETKRFVDGVLAKLGDKRPICCIVNEAGASVYSASETAIKEFPGLDVTVRGAISIGRRLQDPLSELVKIDPKSIGVGQYQHDVNQAKLKASLDEVVESCVNLVGVDVNLASEELLQYVSGLSRSLAGRIVEHRNRNGAFASREALRSVKGMGAKTFEQAAGFLRIAGSANPLDNSAVHPERYGLVEEMAAALSATVAELIGNTELIQTIDRAKFVRGDVGLPTIDDIIRELEKPGRDPREEFRYAEFSDTIRDISDLTPGMKLEGTVTNVTNFGAFVDIGVHHDGLVHISELADRFVRDPREIVKTGQVVNVTVVSVDTDLKRISLSMKSNPGTKAAERRGADSVKHNGAAPHRRPPPPPQTAADRLLQIKQSGAIPKKLVTAKPKFNIRQIMR